MGICRSNWLPSSTTCLYLEELTVNDDRVPSVERHLMRRRLRHTLSKWPKTWHFKWASEVLCWSELIRDSFFLCMCWQCRLLLSTTVRGLYEWRMVAILQWLLDVIKKGLLCICDVYDAAFALCCKFQRAWIVKERCNVVLRSVGVSCVCVYAHCTSSQNCAMTSVFAVGKSFSWANAGDLVLIHCTYYFPSERKLWIIVCLLIWKVYDVVQDALRVLYVPWFIDVSTGDRTVCG